MSRLSRSWRRSILLAGLTVLAAAGGAVSGFVHRTTLDVGMWTVPVGMAAAWAALLGLMLAARGVGGSRSVVLVVGAAYALPVLVLSQFRPEGDLVIAEDAWGLTLLAGTALVITVAVAVPWRPYDGTAQQARRTSARPLAPETP